MKKHLFIVFLISIFVYSCSDSSTNDGSDRNDGDLGEVTFTVSGAFEADKSGNAFFEMSDEGGGHIFQFIFMDGFDGPQYFASYITRFRLDSFDAPGAGTYEIDGTNHNFSASYDHYMGDWTDADTFSDFYCRHVHDLGGTLIIDDVSSTRMTGSFSFVVAAFDDPEDCNMIGYLDIEGEFRAVPYDWSFDF